MGMGLVLGFRGSDPNGGVRVVGLWAARGSEINDTV